MAAHREKVDLSDDPMASLFEDDFIPESKKPVAKPVRAEAEEPALVSLNFDKVALKGQQKKAAAAVAPKEKKAATTKGDEVVREDLHGDDVRMGLGVDFSSLAPAVRVNALGDVETSRDTAGDVFGVKADPAPRDDLFDDLPEVEPQGVAIRAPTANDKETAKVEETPKVEETTKVEGLTTAEIDGMFPSYDEGGEESDEVELVSMSCSCPECKAAQAPKHPIPMPIPIADPNIGAQRKQTAKVKAKISKMTKKPAAKVTIEVPVKIVSRKGTEGKLAETYIMQNTSKQSYIVGMTEKAHKNHHKIIKDLAELINDKTITTKDEAKTWIASMIAG